jgi:type VI secretion system protein ImpA
VVTDRPVVHQVAGLAQVLATLCAAREAWPEHLHPQGVLEGEFDPGVRANALAALADPDGLLGDVREIVVFASTAMPVSRQRAALRRSGDEAALQLALAADAVGRIGTWCHLRLGDDAPSLEALQQWLVAFTEGSAAPARPASPTNHPAPMRPASAPASQPGGPIASREHARDSIREAREWFELHEPSSPDAVLLKQAEHLVGRRFAEVARRRSCYPEVVRRCRLVSPENRVVTVRAAKRQMPSWRSKQSL